MTERDQMCDITADLMCLSDVHRWGVIKTLRNQSVAEHSFNVAVLAIEIHARIGIMTNVVLPELVQVLKWALIHDLPEVLTADVDGKFKREYPEVKAVMDRAEKAAFPWYARRAECVPVAAKGIVKLADRIEGLAWIEVWGIGARADDCKRENIKLLNDETIPAVASMIGAPVAIIKDISRIVLHHSCSEANSIQLRRHRQ